MAAGHFRLAARPEHGDERCAQGVGSTVLGLGDAGGLARSPSTRTAPPGPPVGGRSRSPTPRSPRRGPPRQAKSASSTTPDRRAPSRVASWRYRATGSSAWTVVTIEPGSTATPRPAPRRGISARSNPGVGGPGGWRRESPAARRRLACPLAASTTVGERLAGGGHGLEHSGRPGEMFTGAVLEGWHPIQRSRRAYRCASGATVAG